MSAEQRVLPMRVCVTPAVYDQGPIAAKQIVPLNGHTERSGNVADSPYHARQTRFPDEALQQRAEQQHRDCHDHGGDSGDEGVALV